MTFSGDRTQTDFSLEERPMKQEIIRKLSAAVAMSLVVGATGCRRMWQSLATMIIAFLPSAIRS